jgi:60 kDa SS-A/Ro ribonucleoprotein
MQTAHPAPGADPARIALYQYLWGKDISEDALPDQLAAHLFAMKPDVSKKMRLSLVKDHNLPWEALPTECNADPDYWEAMLPKMGLTALIRNLGNMSRIGLIKPLSAAEKLVAERLNSEEDLRKSRIHPFNVLVALKTYESGKGFRGSNAWDVSQNVAAALDRAFYKSFKNVEPTGKRFLIGLDVSGSMSSRLQNTNVSCCEATAALALVTASTERQVYINGFCHEFVDLGIRNGMSLNDATARAYRNNLGRTDCALPMLCALEKKLEVDVFIVMTDNETWAGRMHPSEALKQYRRKMGINAKLIVVGMTATGFSIADPNDAGMLDVVGFDSSVPAIMADFAKH